MLFDLRIRNFSISPSLLAGPPPQKDSEDRKAVPAGFLGVSLVVVLNAYDRKFRRLLGQSSDFVFDNRRSVGSGPICRFCELTPTIGHYSPRPDQNFVSAARFSGSARCGASMLANAVLEYLIGAMPIAGDAFDVFFRTNSTRHRASSTDISPAMDTSKLGNSAQCGRCRSLHPPDRK